MPPARRARLAAALTLLGAVIIAVAASVVAVTIREKRAAQALQNAPLPDGGQPGSSSSR